MIKFTGENEKKEPVLGIGLSRRNVELLLKGHPIKIQMEDYQLPYKGEIFILAGETENALIGELDKLGVLRNVPVNKFDERKEQ